MIKSLVSSIIIAAQFLLGQWGIGPGPGTGSFVAVRAPVLVQSNSGFLLSGGGVSVAYATATTAGNFLVAVGNVNTGSAVTAAVSDTLGNTWARAAASTASNGIGVYYCLSGIGGADTVSISGGGGNWYGLHVMEFAGASSGVDTGVTGQASQLSPPISITAGSPVTGTDLVIAGVGDKSGSTYSTPPGYSLAQFINGSFSITSASFYSTAFQVTGTPSITSTPSPSGTYNGALAAFKM